MTIRNPVEWSTDGMVLAARTVRSMGAAFLRNDVETKHAAFPVRTIQLSDLAAALRQGLEDFLACRSDVIFICLFYPVVGFVLARLTMNHHMLPLLFPLVSGFALLGPFAAAGVYEMSRRRERGERPAWTDAAAVLRSPCIAQIVELGLILAAMFLLWLGVAMLLYRLTFGSHVPQSLSAFASDVFTTEAGWFLIIVGNGVGFVFALVVLAVSVVSFPLILDRHVSVATAVRTSVRAMLTNPGPLLAWGLIVACALVLGTIPLLLGLIVVMPILGHATWHLYRKLVA